jgi:hypothetical protein
MKRAPRERFADTDPRLGEGRTRDVIQTLAGDSATRLATRPALPRLIVMPLSRKEGAGRDHCVVPRYCNPLAIRSASAIGSCATAPLPVRFRPAGATQMQM